MSEQRLLSYYSVTAQVSVMLEKGLISCDEYERIEARFAAQYGLSDGDLYRENHLLSLPGRGNMRHDEEVIECKRTLNCSRESRR